MQLAAVSEIQAVTSVIGALMKHQRRSPGDLGKRRGGGGVGEARRARTPMVTGLPGPPPLKRCLLSTLTPTSGRTTLPFSTTSVAVAVAQGLGVQHLRRRQHVGVDPLLREAGRECLFPPCDRHRRNKVSRVTTSVASSSVKAVALATARIVVLSAWRLVRAATDSAPCVPWHCIV